MVVSGVSRVMTLLGYGRIIGDYMILRHVESEGQRVRGSEVLAQQGRDEVAACDGGEESHERKKLHRKGG